MGWAYEVCGRISKGDLQAGTHVEEVEEGYQLRGVVHGQAQDVPRGGRDEQGLGDGERRDAARPVRDGEGEPQRRLQD
jgi:hypothetical protein